LFKGKEGYVILGLVLVLTAFVPSGYTAGRGLEAMRWKFSTFVPDTHHMIPIINKLAAEMTEASRGKVVVDVYHSGVLGRSAEHFDLIRGGTAQIGTVCSAYHPDRFQFSQFGELPFSVTDAETSVKINLELIKKNLLGEEWNEVKLAFPFCTTPSQIQSNRMLSGLGDFRGLRAAPAAGELWSQVWEILGGKGVNILPPDDYLSFGFSSFLNWSGCCVEIPVPDAYVALDRGAIDAVSLAWSGASGFRWQEVTKYPYEIDLMGGATCWIFINWKAWNEVPSDIQAAWEKIFQQQPLLWSGQYDKFDEKGRQEFRASGKEIIPFPPAERLRVAEKLMPLWQKWIDKFEAKGKPAKQVYRTYVEVMKREGKTVVVKIPGLYQE
jgi:TRAP-type C4-dicarboxylate transport system substrate-binding protein